MKKKKNSVKKFPIDFTTLNIGFLVLTVIANLLVFITLYNLSKYSNLSKEIFIVLNLIILVVLIALNVGLAMQIRTRKIVYLISVSCLLILTLFSGAYGVYVSSSVNKNIGKITSEKETEHIEVSYVTYENNEISTLADTKGKHIGYVAGTSVSLLGKEHLANEAIAVEYIEYDSTLDLSLALFSSEIEVAILPSNYIAQLEVNEGLIDDLDKTVVIENFSDSIETKTVLGADKDITSEPFTVLIIGVDEGRSDALMLASVNPISMNVTLTSIARDSYVPIACYSGKNSDKIGHARAVSRECTIDTVEDLVDVEIDYYIESNFKGIVDMVNALGGITVYNETAFVGQDSSSTRGKMTVYVPGGGDVYLNGEQALAFARERKLYASGDFQRQANQQKVIVGVLSEIMRSRDINKVLKMLDAAGDNMRTNFTTDQMITFFNYTIKKANRYYDKEHYERIFNISSSRVMGYNSGLWNNETQTSIYIYRLYKGSIEDTRNAILRNINLERDISADKTIRWSANWMFDIPQIGQTVYNEAKVSPEVPSTLGNFVGLPIGRLQSWSKVFGIQVNIKYVGESMSGFRSDLSDGRILSYDVATGTDASSFSVINVQVNMRGSEPVAVECENGQIFDEKTNACVDEVAETSKVTVLYVDKKTGKEISSMAYADSFKLDQQYTITIQKDSIENIKKEDISVKGTTDKNPYTFSNGKISGVMLDSDITFTVKVTRKAVAETHNLTISYLDKDNNAIANAKVVELEVGAVHTVVAPKINGYTFTAIEGATSGSDVTMGNADINVVVRYKKEEVVSKVLTINYLDSNGNSIMGAKNVNLSVGAVHTVVAPTINGYTFVAFEGTTSGASVTMGQSNMSVTVRYKANEVEPTVPPTVTPTVPPTEIPTEEPIEE
ncbi:MAG: LCP family protein [Anaerorhabdus sp.]